MGSGGRKASFAAILEGQGGQQKTQQISLRLSPIPFILNSTGGVWEACVGRLVGSPKITLVVKSQDPVD